jgi:beta-lactamase class A
MMTISDNVAADALLACVGLDECNAFARQLGLRDTVIVSDLRTTVDSIAQDADFADWQALSSWSEAATPAADAEVTELIRRSRALSPKTANRTTPRDMCELLRAIWTDRAGPPKACQRVRTHMAKQLTRNRIAAGFAPPVRVAAKSGGLMGVVRNEVAAISTASGEVYLATVFTQAQPGASESDINHAIGQVAAAAVRELS